MPKFRNRKDERYGRLLVISHEGKDHRNKHLWKCLCDCGNEKIVVSCNLSSGKSKSCGCLKNEFLRLLGNQYGLYIDREDAILKVQYSHLKRRSKKFSKDCISFHEFKTIVLSDCAYCGARPYKKLTDRSCETKSKKLISDTTVFANGIDRINNKLGYLIDNCAPCCKICNSAKGELSIKDFK